MKARGFTLIELMIVIAFLGILATIIVPIVMAGTSVFQQNTISYGVNGMTEMRCIDGYKFVVGERGQARQVMDELGHGVKCQ